MAACRSIAQMDFLNALGGLTCDGRNRPIVGVLPPMGLLQTSCLRIAGDVQSIEKISSATSKAADRHFMPPVCVQSGE